MVKKWKYHENQWCLITEMNRPCFLPWFCRRSNLRREASRSLRQPGRRTLEAPVPWKWRMNMIVETADDDHCYSPIGACWLQGKGRDIPHSLQRCRNPDINNNFVIITNNNIDSFNNIIVITQSVPHFILTNLEWWWVHVVEVVQSSTSDSDPS